MKRAILLIAALALAGCRTGLNYHDPNGPRYSSGAANVRMPARLHGDTLKFITFNIAFAKEIDSALVVFRTTPELNDPDVVLLQEMDEPGTKRIADALHMSYVYYPAQLRSNTKREWGNAVLSRWPILADQKLVLPHVGTFAKTLRSATGATLDVQGKPLRVYSTHLGTIWQVFGGARNDQLKAIIDDAARFPRVVIGGDMNSSGVGKVAVKEGYLWPTRTGANTLKGFRLDHFFVRGAGLPSVSTGVVADNHHASDHRPVWLKVVVSPAN